MTIALHLCDVFAERPLNGNSLSVIVHERELDPSLMQSLTRELRQFETAFLQPTTDPATFVTRVFDLTRELEFAGHPLLGAAAVLHETIRPSEQASTWRLRLHARDVSVTTTRRAEGLVHASMDQGTATFGAIANDEQADRAARAFALAPDCLAAGFRPQVVSTGLRYLIVPIERGLGDAHVVPSTLIPLLNELNAEFAYLLDVDNCEGRHWENDGSLEDIATGSAAGAVGAYLAASGRTTLEEPLVLRQGRFTGRPSALHVSLHASSGGKRVEVSGPVCVLAHAEIRDDLS